MLATDWAAHAEMPADTIKGIAGISGLYDLEPIPPSHVNKSLQLTEASAERNIPVRQPLPTAPPAANYTWRTRKRRIRPPGFGLCQGARESRGRTRLNGN